MLVLGVALLGLAGWGLYRLTQGGGDPDTSGDSGADWSGPVPTSPSSSGSSATDPTDNTTGADDVSDPKLAELEPVTRAMVAQLITQAAAAGLSVGIESGARDVTKQQALYDAYVSGASKIPASNPVPPGSHLVPGNGQSCAADLHFLDATGAPIHPASATPDSQWQQLANIGRRVGLTAGYYFSNRSPSDIVHFERPDWRLVRAGLASTKAPSGAIVNTATMEAIADSEASSVQETSSST